MNSNNFNKNSIWNLEGMSILAMYYGKEAKGVVTNSRVKYGGEVQHTVRLETPIKLAWNTEERYTILVDHSEVIAVFDSN